jgi:serine protease Do
LLLFLALAEAASAQVLATERVKSSLELLIAFEPVVAEARRATVQILVDQKQVALGSVVDSDGYVLTKASELNGPATCRLPDGRTFAARLIGVRQDLDLAMLKIDARGLPSLRWATRGEPTVGQWLASVGLEPVPLSVGVVSVAARPVPAEQGVLGVVISETRRGPRIGEVIPNSGADRAGLKSGDVVTHVAGGAVRSGQEVTAAIRSLQPGDVLALRVVREERTLDIEARLGAALSDSVSRAELEQELDGELSTRRAGFAVALEHDSVLRPADCGGPVVDLSGEVVAINIARAGRAESYAIPSRDVRRILAELMSAE